MLGAVVPRCRSKCSQIGELYSQFSLIFEENPLADFVELPDDGRAQDELWFSNILCGVLRGALEMVRRRAAGS